MKMHFEQHRTPGVLTVKNKCLHALTLFFLSIYPAEYLMQWMHNFAFICICGSDQDHLVPLMRVYIYIFHS